MQCRFHFTSDAAKTPAVFRPPASLLRNHLLGRLALCGSLMRRARGVETRKTTAIKKKDIVVGEHRRLPFDHSFHELECFHLGAAGVCPAEKRYDES